MSRILIAGCGYLGIALGNRLASEGHKVWGLRRHIEHLSSSIHPIQADLQNSEDLIRIPEELDFIFYVAAADSADDAAYRGAYVVGLGNLINSLRDQRQHPQRIFFTSSTAVYGQTRGEWVDEGSPTVPRDFAGRRLLEAENLLFSGPFHATVLRLAGIYGPGRTRLMDQVRRGEKLKDTPGTYSNRIHRDDCVEVLSHLKQLKAPQQLYIGVDHEPTQQHTVLRWLAERLGPAAQAEATVASLANRKNPSTGARAELLLRRVRSNKRCRNGQLLQSGYQFRYPTFREGYAALLDNKDSLHQQTQDQESPGG